MDTFDKKQIKKEKEKWHEEILLPKIKRALNFLSRQRWLKHSPWYLAGGTALALQVGHRQSVDLDFFTPQSKFNNVVLLRHFKNTDWKTDIDREGTIYGEIFKTKASFIAYPFFLPQQPPKWYGFVRLLQPRDLAVMKVVAISQRGRKRDFFDLYWCVHNLEPLLKIIYRLKKQYPSVAHDYHHILKSLVYFTDAENDPAPQILFDATWKEVKKFFIKEVPKISKEAMKLNIYN